MTVDRIGIRAELCAAVPGSLWWGVRGRLSVCPFDRGELRGRDPGQDRWDRRAAARGHWRGARNQRLVGTAVDAGGRLVARGGEVRGPGARRLSSCGCER